MGATSHHGESTTLLALPQPVTLSKWLYPLGLSLLICKMGGLGLDHCKCGSPGAMAVVLGTQDKHLCVAMALGSCR